MEPFVQHSQDGKPTFFYIESWMNRYSRINAGFTSRLGGVSAEPWGTLNCALHVRDSQESVVRNRQLLAETLSIPFDAWTCAEQVHGNDVQIVTGADRGKGKNSRETALQEKDGMITNEPGIWLTSFYADCVPLYFFDPAAKAVALAHAGWKGTALEIGANVVHKMKDAYGSIPEDILAVIGPSIGPCCYEVDDTVMDKMKSLGLSSAARPGSQEGKYMLDLKEANRQIMIKAGILTTHIEVTQWCTGCNTHLFFSHRSENGTTGRMVSWVALETR